MRHAIRTATYLLMVALTMVLPSAGVAAEPFAVYNLNGTGTPLVTGSPCDITSDSCGTAFGGVTCNVCVGLPSTGNFRLTLPSIRFSPTDPYRSLRVAGTLTITWDTGLVSTAPVGGRFIDGKPFLALSGRFAPSDPYSPGDPYKILLNWPDATSNTAVDGSLAISTR
jgi:rRNA maturation protein Nop10